MTTLSGPQALLYIGRQTKEIEDLKRELRAALEIIDFSNPGAYATGDTGRVEAGECASKLYREAIDHLSKAQASLNATCFWLGPAKKRGE